MLISAEATPTIGTGSSHLLSQMANVAAQLQLTETILASFLGLCPPKHGLGEELWHIVELVVSIEINVTKFELLHVSYFFSVCSNCHCHDPGVL